MSVVDRHHRAVENEFTAERQAVGEVAAVVADRETAGIELSEQWLDVAQDGGAGGGIADMADRGAAPGRRSITSRREKVSPTRPSRRSLWKWLPSKETMPAAS